MINRLRYWTFTSYEAHAPVFQPEKFEYLIYQQEICPKSCSLYWHGFVALKNARGLAGCKLLITGGTVHLEPARDLHSVILSCLRRNRYSISGSMREFGISPLPTKRSSSVDLTVHPAQLPSSLHHSASNGTRDTAKRTSHVSGRLIRARQRIQFYKTRMCPYLSKKGGICNSGENCNYAHSNAELRPPVNLTKTKMCPALLIGCCGKSSIECPFAHNLEELRATESFYKSQLCKFWAAGNCPDGTRCRHAHGEDERWLSLAAEESDNVWNEPPGLSVNSCDGYNSCEAQKENSCWDENPKRHFDSSIWLTGSMDVDDKNLGQKLRHEKATANLARHRNDFCYRYDSCWRNEQLRKRSVSPVAEDSRSCLSGGITRAKLSSEYRARTFELPHLSQSRTMTASASDESTLYEKSTPEGFKETDDFKGASLSSLYKKQGMDLCHPQAQIYNDKQQISSFGRPGARTEYFCTAYADKRSQSLRTDRKLANESAGSAFLLQAQPSSFDVDVSNKGYEFRFNRPVVDDRFLLRKSTSAVSPDEAQNMKSGDWATKDMIKQLLNFFGKETDGSSAALDLEWDQDHEPRSSLNAMRFDFANHQVSSEATTCACDNEGPHQPSEASQNDAGKSWIRPDEVGQHPEASSQLSEFLEDLAKIL